MKNKNLLLTGILTLSISCPAFATGSGIASDAESASCDNGVLGTYEGSSNLQAQWTANSITLNWYDDSTENGGQAINVPNASTTCTYDGGIVIPEDPEKTGYEFSGWKVRRAAAAPAQCSLTNFNTDFSSNRMNDYNYLSESGSRTQGDTTGLNNGEWNTTGLNFGTFKGASKCSAKIGDNHDMLWGGNSADWSATEEELTATVGEKKYCWCKVIEYTPNDGDLCLVAPSPWVYVYSNVSSSCEDSCAEWCAYAFINGMGFFYGTTTAAVETRRSNYHAALFGQ